MSLMNDVLRDLAKQHNTAHAALDEQQQWLSNPSVNNKPSALWLLSLLVIGLVLVGALVLRAFVFSADNNSPIIVNNMQASDSLATATPSVITEVKPVTDNARSAAAATEQASHTQVALESDPKLSLSSPLVVGLADNRSDTSLDSFNPEDINPEAINTKNINAPVSTRDTINTKAMAINTLLRLANKALTQDKLTLPVDESAYYYYQKILSLEPEQVQALAGLEKIVMRYQSLFNSALDKQQFTQASMLLERLAWVAPQYLALPSLRERLAKATAVNTDYVSAEPVIATQKHAAQINTAPNSGTPVVISNTSNLSESSKPLNQSGKVAITPNREWQEEELEAQARQLIQQGQMQTARLQLEEFLVVHQQATKVSLLLAQLYLEQADLDAADRLIKSEQASAWPLTQQVRLRALWHIASGDNEAAIALLSEHSAEAEADEAYRALLASLYQSTSRYTESAASYRRLLHVFGEKSAYWLGLALALDALEQNNSALEAYQRAYSFQPLQLEVKQYIEQRMAALAR